MYFNQERLEPKKFKEEAITRYSSLISRQFSPSQPAFAIVKISIDTVEDETDMFQLGQNYEQNFMKIKMEPNQFSSWTNYPHLYKFMSVHFMLDQDIQTTERETYSFLAFVGDIGGLNEFLMIFFGLMASPFASTRMKALLTNRLHHVSQQTEEIQE